MDSGFSHFDTAPMYGEGIAERELGRFLGTARNRVSIATKLGLPAIPVFERFPPLLYAHRVFGRIGRPVLPRGWNHRPRSLELANVEQGLTKSMKALQTDWIDLLLLHEPQISDVSALIKLADWLEAQRVSGRVRYLGLAGDARNCVEVALQVPGLFDVLQVEDTVAEHEADAVIAAGWPLQITFGYLRGASAAAHDSIDAQAVIKEALTRNVNGMVLVSSRNPERLKVLASLADNDGASA